MSAVSTESLNMVEEALVAQPSDQPEQVAKELFALVDLIDSNGGFRRALTDPSRPAEERAAMARRALTGQVSEQTLNLLVTAASARWSQERDLADALEQVAVSSVALAAERRSGLVALEETVNELLTFIKALEGSADAQSALADSKAPKEALKKLAVSLGGPATSSEGRLLLERISLATRGVSALKLAEDFVEIIVKRQNRWIARVTSASQLSDQQVAKLQASLTKTYGRDLKLDITLDPSVLGGLRVQVGDEIIDGTLSTRLADLGRALKAG